MIFLSVKWFISNKLEFEEQFVINFYETCSKLADKTEIKFPCKLLQVKKCHITVMFSVSIAGDVTTVTETNNIKKKHCI